MDDSRRAIFIEELGDAVHQRDELNTFIAVLAKRLGVEIPGGGNEADPGDETTPVGNATGDPESAVVAGQYFGMSGTKAARALLTAFGRSRPMKTEEIYRAITKGGVKIKNAGTLYRSLHRDDSFRKIGRGLWGLSEWYPAAKPQADASNGDQDDDDHDHDEPEAAVG